MIHLSIKVPYTVRNPSHKWLVCPNPVSLAATSRISVDFYSFGYWDVSVPRVRSDELCIHSTVHGLNSHAGCPIRKSPDQKMFALPRGLSQLATSFFASQSQGIRPAPLLPDFNSQDRQPLETLTFDLVSPKPPIQLSKILKNKIQKLLNNCWSLSSA